MFSKILSRTNVQCHTRAHAPIGTVGSERAARPTRGSSEPEGSHFPATLLYAAARLYYDEDATQAEVAAQLGTSRATVSRLLAEAKRQGIVRIEVVPPAEARTRRSRRSAGPGAQPDERLPAAFRFPNARRRPRTVVDVMGGPLAPAVGRALGEAGLLAGDVLLVSSGRTVYEVAQYELTPLPGVIVAPTVGGNDQPEEWYQTNEITRLVANRIGGRAELPFRARTAGPELYPSLLNDPSIQRVLHLWPHARGAR